MVQLPGSFELPGSCASALSLHRPAFQCSTLRELRQQVCNFTGTSGLGYGTIYFHSKRKSFSTSKVIQYEKNNFLNRWFYAYQFVRSTGATK